MATFKVVFASRIEYKGVIEGDNVQDAVNKILYPIGEKGGVRGIHVAGQDTNWDVVSVTRSHGIEKLEEITGTTPISDIPEGIPPELE